MEWEEWVCAPRAEQAQREDAPPLMMLCLTQVSIGTFNSASLQEAFRMLELSGTTLTYLFKKVTCTHQYLCLKTGLKEVSSALSFIQLWGMAAGLCAANISSALKRLRWEFVVGRPTITHYCSCSLLADWSPSSFTLLSNWIHQYGMVYCPGLRTGLRAVFPTASGHLTFSIDLWKSSYAKPRFWHKR